MSDGWSVFMQDGANGRSGTSRFPVNPTLARVASDFTQDLGGSSSDSHFALKSDLPLAMPPDSAHQEER